MPSNRRRQSNTHNWYMVREEPPMMVGHPSHCSGYCIYISQGNGSRRNEKTWRVNTKILQNSIPKEVIVRSYFSLCGQARTESLYFQTKALLTYLHVQQSSTIVLPSS